MEKISITSQLELRQINREDRAQFMKLIDRNRVYLRQWLGWLDVTKTEDDLQKFIDSTLNEIRCGKALCFLIWAEGQICGIIHLRDIDFANKKAMIGYWVGEEARGKGIAKQATKALVNFVFRERKLNRIEIRCATGNSPSQAIPRSLGFQVEGTLRENEWLYDHYVDHIVFSILASEWKIE